MNIATEKKSQTKAKLWIDLLIFIVFLVAMDPRSTGIATHEWLTIASMAAMMTHLLLNWQWIVAVTRRFFGKLAIRPRINYILNLVLFVDGVLIMLTGIMISEAAMPALGIQLPRGFAWRSLHDTTANLFIILLGFHTALHWDWIVSTVKRYVLKPFRRTKKVEATDGKEAQA
jgi:Domain of unknown function (DUF4405)